MAAPGNSGFPLRIGESHDGDYAISFDYFVPKNESISFVMYDESNITFANEYLGNQFYWYRISSMGLLLYETTFGQGDKSVTVDGSRIKIDDYSTGVWNSIRLEVADQMVNLYVNDKFIDAFEDIDETKKGCFAMGASSFVMIKNIVFS